MPMGWSPFPAGLYRARRTRSPALRHGALIRAAAVLCSQIRVRQMILGRRTLAIVLELLQSG